MQRSLFRLGTPLLGLCLAGVAQGTTLTVDTFDDVIDTSGDCSLREAVLAANTNTAVDGCAAGESAVMDVIQLAAGTYALTIEGLDESWEVGDTDPFQVLESPDAAIGDLDVLEDLSIVGAGSADTLLVWGGTVGDRLLHPSGALGDDVVFELSGVTLRDGDVGAVLVNPGAPPGDQWMLSRVGGGLAAGGGAVVGLASASGPSDEAVLPGGEGSDAGDVALVLSDVVIEDCFAAGGGGGLSVGGDLDAMGLVLRGNETTMNGGGLYLEGVVRVTDSLFVGNDAEGGGAMFASGPTSGTFERVVWLDNTAVGGGGVSLRSLVDLDLVSNVFSGNVAADLGGAVISNGHARVASSTVVANVGRGDADLGAGGLQSFGSGSFELFGTLLADNLRGAVGEEDVVNCACTGGSCPVEQDFDSAGFNLEDVDTCGLDAVSDLVDTDPMLMDRDVYGGEFEGYALLPGSPAIDAGPDALCAPTDYRGELRPVDGDGDGVAVCDIGAFEAQAAEVDADGDGYCVGYALDGALVCLGDLVVGDCDDFEATRFPGNPEICDALDNDCNDEIDDTLEFVDWYFDDDGDGYGDALDTVRTCDGAPDEYVADGTDCDDNKDNVHPGAIEVKNGLDDDCDGLVDRDDDSFEGACSGCQNSPASVGWLAGLVALVVRRRR